ncbi:ribbon-helix-helix protein, CopG family [Synechococcales cyanobacterium C]|uniref:Ribbon-helix-helix protein, CopG family n=1 Tax=Petrachloros mirabilis ULC683 TaxID=2781853 RepID=A0A8K2A942_9CYAN|nr:ribbon-helix-helix protein, CopG family [Petrachloros mirabilis]NCJ08721.1 ribbon-helix-helix protein, CopG family [Petrachloros mirabilis ULC683]
MRESISVSLPEHLKAEVDRFTEIEGISRSDLVREALREYLFVRKFRSLRQRLIPYAEVQHIYTDEDVFDKMS